MENLIQTKEEEQNVMFNKNSCIIGKPVSKESYQTNMNKRQVNNCVIYSESVETFIEKDEPYIVFKFDDGSSIKTNLI